MAEHLSKVQVAHFKEAFQLLDKDEDGRLNSEDLSKLFVSLGYRADECTPKHCQAIVSQIDTYEIDAAAVRLLLCGYRWRRCMYRYCLADPAVVVGISGSGSYRTQR